MSRDVRAAVVVVVFFFVRVVGLFSDAAFRKAVRSIHVSNLPSRVELAELEDAFKEFCDRPKVELKQGYAFALLSTPEAAEKAMSARIDVKGSTLRLQYARRDTEVKQREKERASMPPSRVLFVVNYDTTSITEG
jgi:hypothetical protein